MDIVEVYVVVGPSNIFFGGRNVPGGYDYLSRNLKLLGQLNPTVFFRVHIAHSAYHGKLGEFPDDHNMEIVVHVFDKSDIDGLDSLDPVLQHGTLLNRLFIASPPTERFLIVLDPDCYCVKKNLVATLLKEIVIGEYAAGGLPYPAWYPKEYSWRTPQLYFSIFDRNRFDPTKLDLRAGGEPSTELLKISSWKSLFLKIMKRIKRLFLRLNVVSDDKVLLVMFENNISRLQSRYSIDPYDTAWRVGVEIDRREVPYKIFPNILKSNIKILGFNSSKYLSYNPDLAHLEGFLGWHFATQGLFEGRQIGSQGFFVKVLQLIFGGKPISNEKWPSKSLVSGREITNYKLLEFLKERIPAADFYAVNQELSFFHLGSKGKGRIAREIQVLDLIVNKILGSQ